MTLGFVEFPWFPVSNTHTYLIIGPIPISVGEPRPSRATRPAQGGERVTSGGSEKKSPETPPLGFLLTHKDRSIYTAVLSAKMLTSKNNRVAVVESANSVSRWRGYLGHGGLKSYEGG